MAFIINSTSLSFTASSSYPYTCSFSYTPVTADIGTHSMTIYAEIVIATNYVYAVDSSKTFTITV